MNQRARLKAMDTDGMTRTAIAAKLEISERSVYRALQSLETQRDTIGKIVRRRRKLSRRLSENRPGGWKISRIWALSGRKTRQRTSNGR